MNSKYILLVEDNPDDLDLTLRAFKQANVANRVEVARDGVEALDFLFATGAHAGRDDRHLPQVVLLDLKLPRVSGLEVSAEREQDAAVTITDAKGNVVARATARWRLRPPPQ